MTALEVFTQSDGAVTRAYYAELAKLGPIGLVAMNLFRAQKTSTRAKLYRGRNFKDRAYEVKQYSLGELCKILTEHGEPLGIVWGWKPDPKQYYNCNVLYVELCRPLTPGVTLRGGMGQVSFHSPTRGIGPSYMGEWDQKHCSGERILAFCDAAMNLPDPRQESLALDSLQESA